MRAVGALSHNPTKTTRPTTASGSQKSGGMASAASAPAIKPAPRARRPYSLLTETTSGRGLFGRRRPDPEAPDTPWIDIEDLELDTRRMPDHLAPLRDAAEQGEDQPADRVDLASLALRQHVADLLFQHLDRRAAVDVDRAVGAA